MSILTELPKSVVRRMERLDFLDRISTRQVYVALALFVIVFWGLVGFGIWELVL